jgi:hypothetical protein
MHSLASQCTRARSAARSGCTALDGSGWRHNRPAGGLCALSTRRVYGDILPFACACRNSGHYTLIFFVKEKFAPVQVKKSMAGSIQAVLAEKRFVTLLAIMGTYVFCRGAFNFAFVLIGGSDLGISDSMVPLLSLRDNKQGTHARRLPCRRAGRQDWQGSRADDLVRRFPRKHGANADKHELSSCFYVLAAVYGAYIGISETVQRALVPKYT